MVSTPESASGGRALLGHYRIFDKIGAGGMGEVYRAHDERLDRDVAIKLLPAGKLADEAARKRFRKEAISLSKLNHPNIATVHDFDTDQGRDFLVMEYIAGTTLGEHMATGPLPESEIAQLGVQMAEGLTAAHGQGVIHRDLKPGNLRLTPDGRLKILDFGLAKLAYPAMGMESTQSLGENQTVAGTLPYMAPEQLRGEACDARTDIYSMGAVLYELATGQQLYPQAKSGELIDSILHREPIRVTKVNPKVSLGLEAVIGKALEKTPARRQQTARELLEQLRALAPAESAGVPATASQWVVWLKWRLGQRQRALFVSAATILVVALIVFWVFSRTPALAFAARDFVLIGDFDNQTGDPVFDKSLTTAFTTSLGQSTYANVYSRRRINETLKRMKRPVLEKVDEAVAQELAVREGLKVVVLPSISGIGNNYRLTATIRDVGSGKDVKTESVKAIGKDKILDAVDTLSAQVRKDLGESMQTVSKSKRLSAVTTQSLHALRQYSLATEKVLTLQWDEAKIYFENALQMDPNFTAARASLGMLHVEQAMNRLPNFDAVKGKRLLNEAVKQVDGLTDREKYGILAFHARAVEGNPEKAVGYLKALMALYPDDSVIHLNLGRTYSDTGRTREAIAEYKQAIRVDPKFVLAYGNMAAAYLYEMGDIASAVPVLQNILELDPENAFAHDALGLTHFARNEIPQAQAEFEKAIAANPRAMLTRYRLAHTHRVQGHYQQALETLQQIQKVDASSESVPYDMGVVYDHMGDRQKARESFLRYRRNVEARSKKELQEPGTQLSLAAVAVRLGETDRARQMLRNAVQKAPQLHLEAACVLSLLGQKKEAVEQMELAIQNGYKFYVWLTMDPDLLPLHSYQPYEQLMAKVITK